jgi:hypothetical protein
MKTKCNNKLCGMYNTLEPNNCYYYVNIECCNFKPSPTNALKFLKDHCAEHHKIYGDCRNCEIHEHCEILECYVFSDLEFKE